MTSSLQLAGSGPSAIVLISYICQNSTVSAEVSYFAPSWQIDEMGNDVGTSSMKRKVQDFSLFCKAEVILLCSHIKQVRLE